MSKKAQHITINSISELHHLIGISKPQHPLISLINLDDLQRSDNPSEVGFILNFYSISLKRNVKGKLKYGQNYYDFDEGVLAIMAPGQLLSASGSDNYEVSGWWLIFHPDFVRNHPIAKTIKDYGFFSYAVNEALHLSEKEEKTLENIMQNIQDEYQSSIDAFSQDVMISHLELLLSYTNRYYNRQFITRESANHDVLNKLEAFLHHYYNNENEEEPRLLTVQTIADKLNLSSHYLSDLLRTLTGQSAQQHLQNALIEKAKESLSLTNLSISQIAFQLGFEHPQSFNKLFKSKTNQTPLEYRQSFN
jgi:AraC family transcriptional regulator, transcriptional activator of pobA